MSNTTLPSGFTPSSLLAWNKYFIPQTDTNAYRVGDTIKSAGGSDASGIVAVTLHTGTGPARGVIVAVDPGLPATGGLFNGAKLGIPAVKAAGYYVWVDDDPNKVFAIVDDGLTPANCVAANVGTYANFTPGVGGTANGSNTSTAALTSSTLGATSGCLKVLSLQPGSAYGAHATWLVKFSVHELATGIPGGGSGTSTIAGATDFLTASLPIDAAAAAAAAAEANAANANANTRVSTALGWTGTVPALVAGVNPFTAFGSNSFVYTGTGTVTLSGQTYYPGDTAVFGWAGISDFTRFSTGGSFLGIFASAAALQAAFPAAANLANVGAYGVSPPYAIATSNGAAYVPGLSLPGSAGLLYNDGAGNVSDAIPGVHYAPAPIFQRTVPVGQVGTFTFQNNGVVTVGTQVGGGTVTFTGASGAPGQTVTATFIAAALAGTAADNNKVITTAGGLQVTVTTSTSTSVCTGVVGASAVALSSAYAAWTITPIAFGLTIPSSTYNYNRAVWCYWPANAIAASGAGSTAGIYRTVWSNSTTATVYNNLYTPGSSFAPPTTLTPFVTTAGTATTNTVGSYLTFDQPVVKGGSMGANGAVTVQMFTTNSASANNKGFQTTFGGGPLGFSMAYSAVQENKDQATFQNVGVTNVQRGSGSDFNHVTVAPLSLAVDTTADQILAIQAKLVSANDWFFIDFVSVTVRPAA